MKVRTATSLTLGFQPTFHLDQESTVFSLVVVNKDTKIKDHSVKSR